MISQKNSSSSNLYFIPDWSKEPFIVKIFSTARWHECFPEILITKNEVHIVLLTGNHIYVCVSNACKLILLCIDFNTTWMWWLFCCTAFLIFQVVIKHSVNKHLIIHFRYYFYLFPWVSLLFHNFNYYFVLHLPFPRIVLLLLITISAKMNLLVTLRVSAASYFKATTGYVVVALCQMNSSRNIML